MRVEIQQLKELKVFNALKLSIKVLIKILADIIADITADIIIEVLTEILTAEALIKFTSRTELI